VRPSLDSTLVSTARGRLRAVLLVLLALALTQCDSGTGPPTGAAGTVTYRLVSPNGAEGALLASIPAADIGSVGGGSTLTQVITRSSNGMTHVAVIHRFGGEGLSFELNVGNTSAPPAPTLVEVVGPNNVQRSLSGYSLEIVP
jgi:hypothetical protein